MNNQNNSIKRESTKSNITVSRVYESDYQKENTLTAELKQVVTTKSKYPGKSISNSLQGNVFEGGDFGFEDTVFTSKETRVAWIDVPTDATKEQVQAKIDALEGATLYRIMSNKPILADTEKYAVNNPDLAVTLDTFANRQAVRYPNGSEEEGELALDNNDKIQYRRIAFSTVSTEDIDRRTEEPTDYYMSEELEAEMTTEVFTEANQSI